MQKGAGLSDFLACRQLSHRWLNGTEFSALKWFINWLFRVRFFDFANEIVSISLQLS